jgi:hypothetical protein
MSDASAGRDMTTRVQVETSACRDMTGQPAQQSGYWEGGDADDRPQEGRRKFQQEKRGAAAYGRPCSSRVRLTGGVLAACGRRVGDVWAACGRRVGGVWSVGGLLHLALEVGDGVLQRPHLCRAASQARHAVLCG